MVQIEEILQAKRSFRKRENPLDHISSNIATNYYSSSGYRYGTFLYIYGKIRIVLKHNPAPVKIYYLATFMSTFLVGYYTALGIND
jgi:hypothetical protein